MGLNEGDAWIAADARAVRPGARPDDGRACEAAGYAVLASASTYFLCVDLAASGIALDDEAFARQAVEQAGWRWCRCRPSPSRTRRAT